MPELSRFFGIIITMYFYDHEPPHFHAKYGSYKACFDIRTLGIMAGHMPPKIHGLIIRWAAYHHEELINNWERCKHGEQPKKIRPLF